MMHLILLHVSNLGVDVIFIVEAIFIFWLSSFSEAGGSKHFFLSFFWGEGYFFLEGV